MAALPVANNKRASALLMSRCPGGKYGANPASQRQLTTKASSVNLAWPSNKALRPASPAQKLGPMPVNITCVVSHRSAVPSASGT